MDDVDLSPAKIHGVNAPYAESHVTRIAASMEKEGWQGRPLLVEEVRNYSWDEYYAWTGSHRIEAAKRAGLTEIPCRLIRADEAEAAFSEAGYNRYGFSCWRDAITSAHGALDKHRLSGLEHAGLKEGAEILREEIRLQDANPHETDAN
jgi:hypothetical protein